MSEKRTYSNPHDALFQRVFSEPEHARGELQYVLPDEIVAQIEWDTLEVSGESFISDELRKTFSDLLFSARLRSGSQVLLYLLVEHKSYADPRAPLQLFLNAGRIWEAFARENPGTKLPALLPVLVFHGRDDSGWPFGSELLNIVELDDGARDAIAPFVPNLRYLLDDLSSEQAELIFSRELTAVAKLALYCLERSRKSEDLLTELHRHMSTIRTLLRTHGVASFHAVFWYATHVQEVSREQAKKHFEAMTDTDLNAHWNKITQDRFDEGKDEGMAKGMAEALLRLLHSRFGELPEPIAEQVKSGSSADVGNWIDRAATANSLDDVFAS